LAVAWRAGHAQRAALFWRATVNDADITLSDLAYLFADKRVAVFAGAGLSVDPPSFCPDWNGFRSMILRALLRSLDGTGLLSGAQEEAFGKSLIADFESAAASPFKPEIFMELLAGEIGDHALGALAVLKGGACNANHLVLARAAKHGHLSVIITTNFDQYIEHALEAEGVPHNVYSHADEFTGLAAAIADETQERVRVVKLHGSLERPETIRMTLRQAARPLERGKAEFLRAVMARYVVLFYGYSGNDDDIYPLLYGMDEKILGIVWCLWSAASLAPAVASLLIKHGDRARRMNQDRKPLFPRLSDALGYSRLPDPRAATGPTSPGPRDGSPDQDQLDRWAAPILPVHVLHILGATSRSISNYDLAKQAFWKELDLLKSGKSWTQYARTNRTLGEVLEMEEDFNSAFDCYGQSLLVTEKLGDERGYADSSTKMAKIQFYLGHADKALELLDASVRVYEKSQLPGRLAEALNVTAEVLLTGKRDVGGAREKWTRSLEILDQDGDLANAAVVSSNLALTFRMQRDYDRARTLLQRAIELDARHGNLQGAASSYGNLAFIEEELNQFDDAMISINWAISILERIGASSALDRHVKIRARIESKRGAVR
jgi:tetratricopeptide (TPR) repeat protein